MEWGTAFVDASHAFSEGGWALLLSSTLSEATPGAGSKWIIHGYGQPSWKIQAKHWDSGSNRTVKA
jgi:hypothetical protein